MRRPRFTIASLLLVVLFVAVAFAALREATDLWDGCAFSLASLTLLTSILIAVHRRERGRAIWLGFCLFGWAYLIASLVPTIESRLPTTRGLAYLDSKLSDRMNSGTWSYITDGGNTITGSTERVFAVSPSNNTLATNQQGTICLWNTATGRLLAGPNGTTENFVRIGHSLMALILGIFGAWLSRRLHDMNRTQRAGEPGASSAPAPNPETT